MWPNPLFPADLVTFTEEILNGKLERFENLKTFLKDINFIFPFITDFRPQCRVTFIKHDPTNVRVFLI